MLTPFLITLKVIKALEECGINYFIGGSLGSSIHGIPRATLDADLVSDLNPTKVDELVTKLKDDFYIDRDMICEAIQHKSCFNLIHLETMFKVDIYILKNDPYSKEEFSRRRPQVVPDTAQEMQIATPEDIILNKLLWYKDGGCVADRQWQDAKGVLLVQGKSLDFQYLEQWSKILGIEELLTKIRREVEKDF